MVDYNPHITGQYSLLYTRNKQIFVHCSFENNVLQSFADLPQGRD